MMQLKDTKETKTLSIRLTTSVSELPKIIGEAYEEIMAYMQHEGVQCSGYPYVLYHNMDMNNLDVDIGWPVQHDANGEGRIKPSTIPGGKVLFATHKGPYSTLENTYKEVMAYIEKNGIKTTEWMYEMYPNSPQDTPPEELITEIYFPVKSE
ncbi:MAG TPA: GyrI-like domain-containing protein [Chitinispirillaceae bacterium]|nr:GyrI-like domain-containing protein [Chitinispirillaceae bacterium]